MFTHVFVMSGFPMNTMSLIIAGSSSLGLLILLFIVRWRKKSKKPKLTLVRPKSFAAKIKEIFAVEDKRLSDLIPELEELMLAADVGVSATQELSEGILHNKHITTNEQALAYLKEKIEKTLTSKDDFVLDTSQKPFVIYLVGVNGVGKTTTIGKLAAQFKSQGKSVMLVAADTFRAAAVDQLRIWSEKNKVSFTGGSENADPSSVIVDGLRSAEAQKIDVVLVDTAGRLQTKSNLMNELQKMTRMCEKVLDREPNEIFLVVDAITGQNGFRQACVFLQAVKLSGVILTKYDATSKGGIIISIVKETGLPIRYVGLGEGIDDLKKFNAKEFVEKMFS